MDTTAYPSWIKTAATCMALAAVFASGLAAAGLLGVFAVQLRFGGAAAILIGGECGALVLAALAATAVISAAMTRGWR